MNLEQIENAARAAGDDEVLELVELARKQEQALTDSNASLMEQTELAVRCRQQAETLEADNTRLVAQMATMQHKPQPTPGVGPCAGLNCGATDGVSHSVECAAEHAAVIAGGRFVPKGSQAVTVDSTALRELLGKLYERTSYNFLTPNAETTAVIAHIDAHTAQAVAAKQVEIDSLRFELHEATESLVARMAAPQQHAQAPQQEGSRPAAYSEMSLGELLERYWNIAFSEGQDGVSRGSEAQEVLSALMALGKDAQAALSDGDIRKAVSGVQPEDFNGVAGVDFLSYDVALIRAFLASQQPAEAPTWKCATCAATSADSCIANGCAACEQDEPAAAPAIQQEGAALDERAAFEKHFGDQGFDILTETDKNGEHYALNTVRAYWVGWSARAALAAPAARVAVPLDLRHGDEVIRHSDQSVRIRFLSARAASEFERQARAALPDSAAPAPVQPAQGDALSQQAGEVSEEQIDAAIKKLGDLDAQFWSRGGTDARYMMRKILNAALNKQEPTA